MIPRPSLAEVFCLNTALSEPLLEFGLNQSMKHCNFNGKRTAGVGMRMCMSFDNYRFLHGLWNCCVFRCLQFVLLSAMTFIMIAAPPNNAVAQFPGVGSEAPSGVATTAYDDVSSDSAHGDAFANDAGNFNVSGNETIGTSDAPSHLNDVSGGSGDLSSNSGIATSTLKKKHHRKQLFIEKLRFEFASIELIEKKTGLPFSRGDVPRYLDELRSDVKAVFAKAKNGEIIEGAIKTIANDAHFIEANLNDHLDQLLKQAGQPVPRKSFFPIMPASSKASLISGAHIDALSLKFELAEYGEKALWAMGARRH